MIQSIAKTNGRFFTRLGSIEMYKRLTSIADKIIVLRGKAQ